MENELAAQWHTDMFKNVSPSFWPNCTHRPERDVVYVGASWVEVPRTRAAGTEEFPPQVDIDARRVGINLQLTQRQKVDASVSRRARV